MAKRKSTKGQATIYKTLHGKLRILPTVDDCLYWLTSLPCYY